MNVKRRPLHSPGSKREHRPRFLGVACLIAVVISPFVLAAPCGSSFSEARRARDEIMPRPPYPYPA